MKSIQIGLFIAVLAASEQRALAALPSATIDFDRDAQGNLLTVPPLFFDASPLRESLRSTRFTCAWTCSR
jgi:hypothetical protein